jgi:alkylation response protein AidB-like acyl-CoA dehydrogenase
LKPVSSTYRHHLSVCLDLPNEALHEERNAMFDHLLTEEQRRVRDEAREFVKAKPRDLILDMDAERVRFPKEWLREAAHRRLLGVRHPVRWGGRGSIG